MAKTVINSENTVKVTEVGKFSCVACRKGEVAPSSANFAGVGCIKTLLLEVNWKKI